MECKRFGKAKEEKDGERAGAIIQGVHLLCTDKAKLVEPENNTYILGCQTLTLGGVLMQCIR